MTSDYGDIEKTALRLRDATNALHAMAEDVASARQILEYSSDRRKNLLAKYMRRALDAGKGVAAAEAYARADADYLVEFDVLQAQDCDAEHVTAKWRATERTFEAARSLMSLSRESLRQLQG